MAKNLNYDEFVEKMKEELKKATPEGYELDFISNEAHSSADPNKVNAVSIKKVNAEQGLLIYINVPMHKDFLDHQGNIREFAESVISQTLAYETKTNVDVEEMLSGTTNIIPCLIKTEGNEEFLKEVPHRSFHDLSVYYRHNADFGTCIIRNEELEISITPFASEEDLCKIAMLNLEAEEMQAESVEGVIIRFWAGNESKNYGSRAILSPKCLHAIATCCGVKKLYVSLVTTDDVMVFPEFDEQILEMHHTICMEIGKKMHTSPLAGSVYCFDTETGELSLVGKGVL